MSKEDIFNTALSIIGGPNQSDYIEDADTDNSTQAIWLRSQWESAVDHCTIEIEPTAARRFAEISQTGDTVDSADYLYVYNTPADCLLIKKLTSSTNRTAEYEYEERGDYIMSDENTDYLDYIGHMSYTDTSKYKKGFANAVAARLARQVAGIWKQEMIPIADGFYNSALEYARSFNQRGKYREKQTLITDIS